MAMFLDPQDPFAQWLDGVDLHKPLSEMIESVWLEEAIPFTQNELTRLEELGLEYVRELFERGMIADLPPMDMPAYEREQAQDKDPDFGR